MRLRDLEQACTGLPPVLAGARRGRLLAVDPLATTWEAWRLSDGARLLLRCLQPRWLQDPVLRRRFLAAPARGAAVTVLDEPGAPTLCLRCPGTPLIDRLPAEDPPSTLALARLLGAGLAGLHALHARGLCHGGPLGALLVDGPQGATLAWLDGLHPGRTPAQDLAGLGRVVAALDPHGLDPIGLLAATWAQDPPPSARDGLGLLRRALAGELLARRHSLALAARRVGRRDRAGRLAALARRLEQALPPPPLQAQLPTTAGGPPLSVHSDGRQVRGGAADDHAPDGLPRVWTPALGLDAQAARMLLRAWSAQAAVAGQPLPPLARWLRAQASLRRARLLLAVQARPDPAPQSSATVTR